MIATLTFAGHVVTRSDELRAGAVLVLELVIAVFAYQEAARTREKYGRSLWGWPPLLWAILSFIFSILMLIPMFVALSAARRSGRAGAGASPAAVAPSATGSPVIASAMAGAPAAMPGGMAGATSSAAGPASVADFGPVSGPVLQSDAGFGPSPGTGQAAATLGAHGSELMSTSAVATTSPSPGGLGSAGGVAAATATDLAGGAAPAATASSGGYAADWYADPMGRHELRYYDGTAWTDWVSDAGVTSTDPVSG